MPIRNDAELGAVAAEVSRHLQDIQNYLGAEPGPLGKFRFPRGFIRTADYFRARLPFILDRETRDNLAYSLILTDVYRWLTIRTDIFGTAREMVLKSAIVLAGSICETMAVKVTVPYIGRNARFKPRCTQMASRGQITQDLRNELHWLWDTRSAIHICDVDGREYERYNTSDYNRAILCVRALRDQLDEYASANAAF